MEHTLQEMLVLINCILASTILGMLAVFVLKRAIRWFWDHRE